MNERIRNTITSLARPMKLDRLIRWSGQTSIFPFYHTVSPESLPHISHLYSVLKPAEFEKDLDQLLLCFEPLSLGDYLENKGMGSTKPNMVLTFDDGLEFLPHSSLTIALLITRDSFTGIRQVCWFTR